MGNWEPHKQPCTHGKVLGLDKNNRVRYKVLQKNLVASLKKWKEF